jgi:tetratricopeptide (TPR) repeat protein
MRQALSQGRFTEAADILGRLQREDPLGRETRGFELEYHLATDRLSEADKLARQLCQLFPDSARIWLLAGRVAYRQKRYTEAESCFRESNRIFPSRQAELWLGKTLTQTGKWEEAEALLLSVRQHYDSALLDLGWLYERRGDLDAAVSSYDAYLALHPEHQFASERRLRLKARALEPEDLIEEAERLAEFGEELPDSLYAEYIEKLLTTGQSQRVRDEVKARVDRIDSRVGQRIAWACYRAQAYDLACDLFLKNLEENLGNFKYLNALESAAGKCNRLEELIEAYRKLAPLVPKLHGRVRTLARRLDER